MRTVVAFGTKFGSTEKVAQEMALVLRSNGHNANVLDLRKSTNEEIVNCDMAVIGSGIFCGSWSKESLSFLERNRKNLRKIKLAMFACCGDLMLDPSREEELMKKYLLDIADGYGFHPISLGLFGGVLDFRKYGPLARDILNVCDIGGKDLDGKPGNLTGIRDFRNWDDIRNWVASLEGVRK